MRWRCFSFVCSFQSTHPSGVRQAEFPAASQPVAISIHAPQWGATGSFLFFDWLDVISIHAPQWGATRASGYNTNRTTDISIHAPQWGATSLGEHNPELICISIHAPQWGATGLLRSCFAVCLFQSTHPSGVRHPRRSHRKDPRTISIHAPQWGATGPNQSATSPRWNFNPRTPVGCDRQRMRGRGGCDDFNPRTPVGCDQYTAAADGLPRYFNPRTPVGCDSFSDSSTMGQIIFQSTHPSGVRRIAIGM